MRPHSQFISGYSLSMLGTSRSWGDPSEEGKRRELEEWERRNRDEERRVEKLKARVWVTDEMVFGA